MKVFKFTLLLTILLFSNGPAQTSNQKIIRYGFDLCYARYAMQDLKNLNRKILNQTKDRIPGLATTENFPAFVNYALTFYFPFLRTPYGVYLNYSSTGSRNTYGDYSGTIYQDLIVRRVTLGLFTEHSFDVFPHHQFYIAMRFGNFVHWLVIDERLSIDSKTIANKSKFWGLGLKLEPNIGYRFEYESWQIGFYLGYEFDLPVLDLRSTQNFDSKLFLGKSPVNPEWKGLRLGLTLSYSK